MRAFIIALWLSSVAQGAQYRAVAVATGDLFQAKDPQGNKIWLRVVGIAAPKDGQDYFKRARTSLSRMVYSGKLDVDFVDASGACVNEGADRCVRMAKVFTGGVDVGLAQIRLGSAWHAKANVADQSTTDRALYLEAETKARRRKAGLWMAADPQPPWAWVPPPVERKTASKKHHRTKANKKARKR